MNPIPLNTEEPLGLLRRMNGLCSILRGRSGNYCVEQISIAIVRERNGEEPNRGHGSREGGSSKETGDREGCGN